MREQRIAVYALTPQGLERARGLARALEADLHAPASLREGAGDTGGITWFPSLPELVRENFHRYSGHIFFAATGIAVRVIAPLLRGKDRDPAVLVADHKGRHVISLLSGHLGGANALTRKTAALLGAAPVITTATDLEDLPALDDLARERDLAVADPAAIKAISAALVAGKTVALFDPQNRLGIAGGPWEDYFTPLNVPADAPFAPAAGPRAVVAEYAPPAHAKDCLVLHPKTLCVGVGCRKGTGASAILDAIKDVLAAHALALPSVACLSSVEDKREEAGLVSAAHALEVPLLIWPREVLAAWPVTAISPKAVEVLGIQGVCEPAALAAASPAGPHAPMPRLMVAKTVLHGVTVAVTRKLM